MQYPTHLLTTMLTSKEFKSYYSMLSVEGATGGTTAIIQDNETGQAYKVEVTIIERKKESAEVSQKDA